MAQTQLGQIDPGFSAKTIPSDGSSGNSDVATPANYASINAMRTRLAAISGTTYTAAVLDQMSVNDMVYALRMNDDPGTI